MGAGAQRAQRAGKIQECLPRLACPRAPSEAACTLPLQRKQPENAHCSSVLGRPEECTTLLLLLA